MPTTTERPTVSLFHPDDLRDLCNRDGMQSLPQTVIDQAAQGVAFTARYQGRVLGCAGMVLPWPGIGMAWMVLGEDVSGHGLWLTRTVRGFIKGLAIKHQLHRIEAVALEESERNNRWLKSCGFTRERNGVAQRYLGDGRNMIRYEWIQEAAWPK